jgi:hypothetical protein
MGLAIMLAEGKLRSAISSAVLLINRMTARSDKPVIGHLCL